MSALASQGALERVSQIFVGKFPVRKSFCGRNVVFKNERKVLIRKEEQIKKNIQEVIKWVARWR